MTNTQSLSERLRKDAAYWHTNSNTGDMECEAADALDAKDAEIERLREVRDLADLLVNECEGGRTPPSLGILAQLESALAMEHKGRAIT